MNEIQLAQLTLITLIVILCFWLGYMYNEYRKDKWKKKFELKYSEFLEIYDKSKKEFLDKKKLDAINKELDKAIESKWTDKQLKELKKYEVIGTDLIWGLKKWDMVEWLKYKDRIYSNWKSKAQTKIKILKNWTFYSQNYKKFKQIW